MPCRAEEEQDVDEGERVVDGLDEEAIEGEDEAGEGERGVLRERDLLERLLQVDQRVEREEELGHLVRVRVRVRVRFRFRVRV